jgi:cytochrome bd-type quinol oxidase subunit 1
MATRRQTAGEGAEQVEPGSTLSTGSVLMALAGIAFVGYGVAFLILNFVGSGFEIGVSNLGGLTPSELHPSVAYYVSHLHVATAAFIISTGIAVGSLSWYGVRQGRTWAWATAVVAAVVGLALALPMHWTGESFAHDWLVHLGPIYLATLVFVVGAVLAFRGLRGQ